jgi:hypothetical protein
MYGTSVVAEPPATVCHATTSGRPSPFTSPTWLIRYPSSGLLGPGAPVYQEGQIAPRPGDQQVVQPVFIRIGLPHVHKVRLKPGRELAENGTVGFCSLNHGADPGDDLLLHIGCTLVRGAAQVLDRGGGSAGLLTTGPGGEGAGAAGRVVSVHPLMAAANTNTTPHGQGRIPPTSIF